METEMTHPERFRAIMEFQPVDRLPRWEWAMWWDETIERWHREGLSEDLTEVFEIDRHFGLDPYKQFWFSTTEPTIGEVQHHVEGIVSDMEDYCELRPQFYPDHSEAIQGLRPWFERQEEGDAVVWITLEGFFWFPRTLMGFTDLMVAFYEQPALLHEINQDLLEFNLDLLEKIGDVGSPVFATIAEDMSYNHGPMISRELCDEFLTPYYEKMLARLNELGTYTIVDTDGDVTSLVPWLQSVGVDGVLPLERQAGVDAGRLREQFPDFCMVGHFNKLVMDQGEEAIREEFERLTPLMEQGGFIPSVDHQTPPRVSLEQYHTYLRLLREYTAM